MKPTERSLNPRQIRHRLGLNQQEFWGRIGVTQSGGSRYESGRSMPKPVKELLRLVHVDQIDVRKITRHDFQVLSYLKSCRTGAVQAPAPASLRRGRCTSARGIA